MCAGANAPPRVSDPELAFGSWQGGTGNAILSVSEIMGSQCQGVSVKS